MTIQTVADEPFVQRADRATAAVLSIVAGTPDEHAIASDLHPDPQVPVGLLPLLREHEYGFFGNGSSAPLATRPRARSRQEPEHARRAWSWRYATKALPTDRSASRDFSKRRRKPVSSMVPCCTADPVQTGWLTSLKRASMGHESRYGPRSRCLDRGLCAIELRRTVSMVELARCSARLGTHKTAGCEDRCDLSFGPA